MKTKKNKRKTLNKKKEEKMKLKSKEATRESQNAEIMFVEEVQWQRPWTVLLI